jgi:hypothetical protein
MRPLLLPALLFACCAPPGAPQSAAANAAPHGQPSPPTACPWLTPGSAARVLGGDVSVAVTVTKPGEGACRFSQAGQPMDSLEIDVGGSSNTACPEDGTRLTGIGNEAVRCRLPASHGATGEMVSGRVRDVHFTLILRGQKRPSRFSDERDDPLAQLAEQVAGNLF